MPGLAQRHDHLYQAEELQHLRNLLPSHAGGQRSPEGLLLIA